MRTNDPFQILQSVRNKIVCSACQHQFGSNAIELVELVGNRGVFATHCTTCNCSAMLVLNVREFKQRIARRGEQIEKVNQSRVSPNDVIGIKDFLNSFSGTLDTAVDPHTSQPTPNPLLSKTDHSGDLAA